ncbi:MAG: hypothetical protein N2652_09930 [Kiritimatiellae bacterium]|nr:hypothetical protein [Kiritimatiellia bacterium]
MVWQLGAGAEIYPESERPAPLLGDGGVSLLRLSMAKFPVPPGFVISGEVCAFYARSGGRFPPGAWDQIRQQLARLERAVVSERDRAPRPLLLRVRAAESIADPRARPFAMVIGFSERAADRIAEATGRGAPGWRGWARLLRAYGAHVLGAAPDALDDARTRLLRRHRVASESALSAEGARELCAELRRVLWDRVRQPIPVEIEDQLRGLLAWLYEQWHRAALARAPASRPQLGVPVVATVAVLSDLDEGSVACAAWSRDPISGAPGVWGRLLPDDTQLPDPSAGLPLATLASARDPQLRAAHAQICRLTDRAERLAGWPQLVEYVVERGRLWTVGAMCARPSAAISLRWAVDLAGEDRGGESDPVRESLLRLLPDDLRRDRRPAASVRRVRQTVIDWCRANRRLEMLVFLPDVRPPIVLDAAASDGVVWWPDACEAGEELWADMHQLLLRHRGRRVIAVLPAGLLGRCHGGEAQPRPAPGRSQIPLQPLVQVLRRTLRARGRPRLAVALPVGDLDEAASASVEELRAQLREVLALIGRNLSVEAGVAIRCPRAVLVMDSIAESADFALLDLDHLDGALRGRVTSLEPNAGRPFDAEGLGVLIESGVRRLRAAHSMFRVFLAMRTVPSPALLRFCSRLGVAGVVVPDELVAPAGLVAAQTAIRLETAGRPA